MLSNEYLETSRHLLAANGGRPSQPDLRKAVSIAYYAAFYALCRTCADCLIGAPGPGASKPAWRQVFRAVEHGHAKRQCMNRQVMAQFPEEIQGFAEKFRYLQEIRHEADYDPDIRLDRDEAREWVELAAEAITHLGDAPMKDRRAFAAWVSMKARP